MTFPAGQHVQSHSHEWPQLVYAVRGVISVSACGGAWVVPPMRALWIGAAVEHALHMRGRVEMQTLYFRPDIAPVVASPCVIAVSPLLRELIVSVVAKGMIGDSVRADVARRDLIVELLHVIPERPLQLPMPTDARARRIAEGALANMASHRTISALAKGSGASARTIERVFVTQTGMSLGRWCQHARMHEAIGLLGEGMPVSSVARRVGYRSSSAFVAAFGRCLGKTPAQYFRHPE